MTQPSKPPARGFRGFYERATGTPFPKWAAVHHIDGDPRNNDPANLEIVDIRENRRAPAETEK